MWVRNLGKSLMQRLGDGERQLCEHGPCRIIHTARRRYDGGQRQGSRRVAGPSRVTEARSAGHLPRRCSPEHLGTGPLEPTPAKGVLSDIGQRNRRGRRRQDAPCSLLSKCGAKTPGFTHGDETPRARRRSYRSAWVYRSVTASPSRCDPTSIPQGLRESTPVERWQ
jgi:hypothetical protein